MKRSRLTIGLGAFLLATIAWPASAQPQDEPARQHATEDSPSEAPTRSDLADENNPRQDRERRQHSPNDRRGPRRGEDEHGPDRRPNLTAQDLEAALAILDEIQPELAQRFRAIAEEDADRAVRVLNERFPRVVEMLQMQRDNPDRFALHVRSMNIMRTMRPRMRTYREAAKAEDDQAIADARAAIRENIEALFDIRLELRLMEIQDLRDQIAELEAQLEDHRNQRDTLIDEQTDGFTNSRGRFGPPDHWRGRPGRESEDANPSDGNRRRPGPPRDGGTQRPNREPHNED